jgi:hypothetical protein
MEVTYVCCPNHDGTVICCFDDGPLNNTIPSKGISRIMGKWSAAYDSLPTTMVRFIMKMIVTTGVVPPMNQTVSVECIAFMQKYVEVLYHL